MPDPTQPLLRAGTLDDLDSIIGVAWANEERSGDAPPAYVRYHRHLLEVGTVAVAEATDEIGSPIVGFAAAVETGRSTHLADVFVRPDHQGVGIGRILVREVLDDRWPRTTFSSADPRALPTYVRAGMTALWPNLYIAGDPARLPSVTGYDVVAESLDEVVRLEERWTGAVRDRELDYWRELPASRPFLVTHAGQVVACGQARARIGGEGHWLNRAVVAPDAEPLPSLLAAFRAGAPTTPLLGGCLLGPSPLVRALLEAGWRIVDRDVFQASEPSLVDPAREVVNTGFL